MKRAAAEFIPPPLSLRLRALKNRRRLFGIYAPASTLSSLVPPGSVAIDAGANRGLYTFWIARHASLVHAFEPIESLATYVRSARLPRVRVHHAALSDTIGRADLWIPIIESEASLSKPTVSEPVSVKTVTLDSLRLCNVGFIKIDVEGHEIRVLNGARQTIEEQKPNLFIEIEQRHHPEKPIAGLVEGIFELGYSQARFLQNGRWHPIEDFNATIHQPGEDVSTPGYVSNFLFFSPQIGRRIGHPPLDL